MPIIFHKRIPKLKEYTSKKARFFFGILFLSIPIITSSVIYGSSQTKIKEHFQKKEEAFKLYRLTGDITKINPNIQFIKDIWSLVSLLLNIIIVVDDELSSTPLSFYLRKLFSYLFLYNGLTHLSVPIYKSVTIILKWTYWQFHKNIN